MKRLHYWLACVAIIHVSIFVVPSADAVLLTNNWINTATSGVWTDAVRWSLGVAPSNNHAAIVIANASNKTVTVAFTTPIGNRIISNLTVQGFGATTNTLLMVDTSPGQYTFQVINGFTIGPAGALMTTGMHLRVDGQSGGLFIVNGVAQMGGHSVTVTNTDLLVGAFGTFADGRVNLGNPATLLAREIVVGRTSASVGTLTVGNATTARLTSSLSVGAGGVFAPAVGTVWVTGGRLVVTNGLTIVGDNFFAFEPGTGDMIISNGTVLGTDVFLGAGEGSLGRLSVIGGTSIVYNAMTLGGFTCTATGIVTVAGGRLFVTNAAVNAVLDLRSGSLILNSGTLAIDKLVITNGCAHFTRTGGTLSITTTNLGAGLDADSDGLPNDWEQAHGLSPLDATGNNGANGDPDLDGFTNLQEFQAGTDPQASSSTPFRIAAIARESNNIRITWSTVPGTTNALQRTAGIGGSYSTNSFTPIFTVTNTVGTVTNFIDVGAATNFPARYYRVRLVQ